MLTYSLCQSLADLLRPILIGAAGTPGGCADRAVEECDQLMMPIKSYGFFDPMRGDARFAAGLRKMHLEP